MGRALVTRLLDAGHEVAVYNRTREKAQPLAELGATIVDSPADLADRDIVFTMVAGSADVEEIVTGDGLLSREGVGPGLIVDSTTISPGGLRPRSAHVAERRGTAMLAAPVSGNPKVAASGRLTIVASGPREAWDTARPYLELLGPQRHLRRRGRAGPAGQDLPQPDARRGRAVHGRDHRAGGEGRRSRADFLEFLNDSVMGSTFTRYKTPAYVNLDFTPTFTPELLLKDFHLGFEAARENAACRCRWRRRPSRSSRA